MEELNISKSKNAASLTYAFKLALIFAVYIVLLQLVYKYLGIHPELNQEPNGFQKYLIYFLNYVPYFVAIYLVQKAYSKENAQFNYLQRFSAGFKVVGFIAIFASIAMFLYFHFFAPEVFEKMKEMSIQSAGDNEMLIRNAKKMAPYIGLFNLFGSVFGYLIMGIPLVLISALLIPNKK